MSKTKSSRQPPSDMDDMLEVEVWLENLPCGHTAKRFSIIRKIRDEEDGDWITTDILEEGDLPTLKQAVKLVEQEFAELSVPTTQLRN